VGLICLLISCVGGDKGYVRHREGAMLRQLWQDSGENLKWNPVTGKSPKCSYL
jgi:hypothetical protein